MTPDRRQNILSQILSMMQSQRLEGMYSTKELNGFDDDRLMLIYNYLLNKELNG